MSRRIALAVVLLLSGVVGARAWLVQGVAPAYVGPGDIANSSFHNWWGLRCFSAAKATGSSIIMVIRRASDNTTQNLVCLTSGRLDTATATTFCASTTCFVSDLVDQVAGCDLLQGTLGNQPQLFLSGGPGGNPYITSENSSTATLATTTCAVGSTQPWSIALVADRTSFGSLDNEVLIPQGLSSRIGFGSTSGDIWTNANTGHLTPGYTEGTWTALQWLASGASSVINIDGTETTISNGTGSTGTAVRMFGTGGNGCASNCRAVEAGISFTGWTSTVRNALEANEHAFWGF